MTSTEPAWSGGAGSTGASEPGRPGRRWWVLGLVAAVVVAVLLVAQPWADHQSEPVVQPTTPVAAETTASASPRATPTAVASPTTPPVPGAEAQFDDATVPALFVRRPALEQSVPAAADGVDDGMTMGELSWGLPAGSSIEPPTCTTARTVVATAPPGYVARSLVNDQLDFAQELTLLADATAAQAAFRDLVTTVDGCPTYTQVTPGVEPSTWTAEPAIEGLGVYPAIVQEVVHTVEGMSEPAYRGHMLVGNVIVTWTATALGDGDDVEARLATLGSPESLSTMVQDRAQTAVALLS